LLPFSLAALRIFVLKTVKKFFQKLFRSKPVSLNLHEQGEKILSKVNKQPEKGDLDEDIDNLRTLIKQLLHAQLEELEGSFKAVDSRFDRIDAALKKIKEQISPKPPVRGGLFFGTPVQQ
jgi:peptidoglycan hydrolase CwlO-like protein